MAFSSKSTKSPLAARLIIFFGLLNQWYGADLDIQEFRMLHNLRMGFDGHYYFSGGLSFVWESYIQDVPCQDKGWIRDIFVIDGNWKGKINKVRVKALLFKVQNSTSWRISKCAVWSGSVEQCRLMSCITIGSGCSHFNVSLIEEKILP